MGARMSEVPALRTPLTRDATAAALVPAYVRVFGVEPDRNRAELLLAQVWLENDNGQAIIQRNIGNLSGDAGSFWRPPWFDADAIEALPDSDPSKARYLRLHKLMLVGQAPSAFRAFDTFEQGFDAWLRLLGSPAKAAILHAASSGDANAFAAHLHAANRSTDFRRDLDSRLVGCFNVRLGAFDRLH